MTEPELKSIQIDPDGKYLLIIDDPSHKLPTNELEELATKLQEWWGNNEVRIPMVLVDHGFNMRLEKLEVVGE